MNLLITTYEFAPPNIVVEIIGFGKEKKRE